MQDNVITSNKNQLIQKIRKLHTVKGRKQFRQYIVEGEHLVAEAIKSGQIIVEIIVSESYDGTVTDEMRAYDIVMISDSLVTYIAQTQTSQGIFALIQMPNEQMTRLSTEGHRYLLIDAVQDPGNLGTMIRTAAAANYDAIINGEGSVDIYNDKVIRATQGALWYIPIITMNLLEAMDILSQKSIKVYATSLHTTAIPYDRLDASQSMAFIVGNEGAGVSQSIQRASNQVIYIPMPGQVESLNVAVATGIILFHYVNNS